MSSQAKTLIFNKFDHSINAYIFEYLVDEKKFEIKLSHSSICELKSINLETVLFNLGMCYLVDIAEIVTPASISINFNISPTQLAYWQTLYREVSREKMYIYKLDLALLEAHWEINASGQNFKPFKLINQNQKVSLCLTGGKESLTLLKLLENKKDLLLFFLNPETSVHRQKVYDKVKNKFFTVKTVSNRPEILTEIKQIYNSGLGSGVDMAHLVFNTLLFNTQYVLIGNEYSSNFPNFIYQGYPINHQYVKSLHFANNLNKYLAEFVTPDFKYYSPFFGLFEYKIASQLFKTDEYLDVWTSCNKTTPTVNFCSNCHKCAFTYLISLLYTSEINLTKFFSKDLLADVELFKPLMDFTGEKPLDCVGEKIEVWTALEDLSKLPAYANKPVIEYFKSQIRPFIEPDLIKYALEVNSIKTVPAELPDDLRQLIIKNYPD